MDKRSRYYSGPVITRFRHKAISLLSFPHVCIHFRSRHTFLKTPLTDSCMLFRNYRPTITTLPVHNRHRPGVRPVAWASLRARDSNPGTGAAPVPLVARTPPSTGRGESSLHWANLQRPRAVGRAPHALVGESQEITEGAAVPANDEQNGATGRGQSAGRAPSERGDGNILS